MKRNAGFTLIELVIVIIVLGILAATAVPKFINLQDDAKVSAMKGVEAAVHSAANIVYSKAAIDGVETTASKGVSAAGSTVAIDFGYPSATSAGIATAVELSGFKAVFEGVPADTIAFVSDKDEAENDLCILYTEAKAKDGIYTLKSGKINSGATQCTPTP